MHRFFVCTSLLLSLGLAAAESSSEWRLEDGDLSLVKSGWGQPKRDLSVGGQPLAIGGKSFAHGLGVHAASDCTLRLDGKAREFRASVGLNDKGGNEAGKVEFRVVADGKTLWSSGEMTRGDAAKEIKVSLIGVRKLRLEVDPLGDISSDHADWADAVISYGGLAPLCIDPNSTEEDPALYPPADKLVASPGDTSYFVDPATGDDAAAGTAKDHAWKSIAKLNSIKFAPGDKIFIAPGLHSETLKPSGAGSASNPVTIEFRPGRHEFGVEIALRRPYFISNSCDAPKEPKPIGFLFENVQHFRLQGADLKDPTKTSIVFGGRMIQIVNDHAEDISFRGLAFDLKRPTVSEFRCLEADAHSALIQVAEGSDYTIKDGKFLWQGDWGQGGLLCQEAIPAEGRCWRSGAATGWSSQGQQQAVATDLGSRKVRLDFGAAAPGLTPQHQYHFRQTKRDSCGVHNTRSKDLVFEDCNFYALTNMGCVSQFTENIVFRRVKVAPPAGTIRTCAAWADIFQFSNCKGDLLVENCRMSGMQDDSINCHGTHLRIIGQPAPNQLLMRFMHGQTFGFAAYAPGDEIAVIQHDTLREIDGNPRRKVTAIERKSDQEWQLTLDGPAPKFAKDDVLDNMTWQPNLIARGNLIDMDPVRGFLLTTRGKVLIEGNTFHRCAMAGILVEDDAEGWFESSCVRDLLIRNNKFIGCGIQINPQNRNSDPALPVHENIRIEGNFFDGADISAKSVKGLSITGNTKAKSELKIQQQACSEVKIEGNKIAR